MESWERHDLAHRLHRFHLIPKWLLNRLCDRHDVALGLYDDDDIDAGYALLAEQEEASGEAAEKRLIARWRSPDSWRIDG
jgi:hypothetical protein